MTHQRRKTLVLTAALAAGVSGLFTARSACAAPSVEKLQEFDLDEVQVTDPYYQNLFSKDTNYMLTTLNVDRLLAPFKAVSQGQDPGTASGLNLYGGWEAASSLLRGHTLGHYMSALGHAYLNAKGSNPALATQLQTRIDYTIAQLKSFQDKNSSGYLFGSPPTQFDVIEGKVSGSSWVPWYTMHKIIAGLLDIYELEGNPTALAIASKLGDWTYARASGWSAATRTKVLGIEYGGMNDCLYELYKHTNNPNHLAAAHIFDETTLFTPISQGNDTLNGMHANATIPKFIGALNRYRTLGAGEASYFTAADEFWTLVLKDHTYVTGGHGEDEHFHVPGKLDAIRDDVNNESCNAYNMSKLARELFKITGDVKYADYYERTQINEVLSAMNPVTGMTTYFKPMGTGYFKAYGTADSTFWCCNGTGMENYTKLGDSLYFHDASDLWVVGYVSSSLSWSTRGLTLEQVTTVPVSNTSTFTIGAAPADAVNIHFRVPWWLARCQSVSITVNGQPVTPTQATGFLGVSRVWHAGDEITLSLPAEVQVSRLPDNANAVAFTYGPVVLSAGLGTAQMTTTGHALTIAATKPAGIQDTIAINGGTTINQWLADIKTNLVQTPGKLEFKLKNTDSDDKLTFTPQYQRYQDRYGIYFKLAGTTGGTIAETPCPVDTGAGGSGGSAAGGASSAGNGAADSGSGGFMTSGGASGAVVGGSGGASVNNGGASGSALVGNTAGASSGSMAGTAGSVADNAPSDASSNSGCSCNFGDVSASPGWTTMLLLLAGLLRSKRVKSRHTN